MSKDDSNFAKKYPFALDILKRDAVAICGLDDVLTHPSFSRPNVVGQILMIRVTVLLKK